MIRALTGNKGPKELTAKITAQAEQPAENPHQRASQPLVMEPMVSALQPHHQYACDRLNILDLRKTFPSA